MVHSDGATGATEKMHAKDTVWRNAADLTIEGQGWRDSVPTYHRFPARARTALPPNVWKMSCQPSGIRIGFRTDAKALFAKWRIAEKPRLMGSMTMQAAAGLDCYGKTADWQWLGCVPPGDSLASAGCFGDGLDGQLRDYRVYLPECAELLELTIGAAGASVLEKTDPDARKPIVYYGTSVVQGVTASRPGMSHPSILQRRLGYPLINLGISGNGCMDKPVAELCAELDAALYIIDCLPNTGQDMVRERLPVLVNIIRAKHPNTPVLFVGDRLLGGGAFVQAKRNYLADQDRVQRECVDKLAAQGVTGLSVFGSENLFGADGSTDGSHPSDLGAMRVADQLEPVLKKLLGMK